MVGLSCMSAASSRVRWGVVATLVQFLCRYVLRARPQLRLHRRIRVASCAKYALRVRGELSLALRRAEMLTILLNRRCALLHPRLVLHRTDGGVSGALMGRLSEVARLIARLVLGAARRCLPKHARSQVGLTVRLSAGAALQSRRARRLLMLHHVTHTAQLLLRGQECHWCRVIVSMNVEGRV